MNNKCYICSDTLNNNRSIDINTQICLSCRHIKEFFISKTRAVKEYHIENFEDLKYLETKSQYYGYCHYYVLADIVKRSKESIQNITKKTREKIQERISNYDNYKKKLDEILRNVAILVKKSDYEYVDQINFYHFAHTLAHNNDKLTIDQLIVKVNQCIDNHKTNIKPKLDNEKLIIEREKIINELLKEVDYEYINTLDFSKLAKSGKDIDKDMIKIAINKRIKDDIKYRKLINDIKKEHNIKYDVKTYNKSALTDINEKVQLKKDILQLVKDNKHIKFDVNDYTHKILEQVKQQILNYEIDAMIKTFVQYLKDCNMYDNDTLKLLLKKSTSKENICTMQKRYELVNNLLKHYGITYTKKLGRIIAQYGIQINMKQFDTYIRKQMSLLDDIEIKPNLFTKQTNNIQIDKNTWNKWIEEANKSDCFANECLQPEHYNELDDMLFEMCNAKGYHELSHTLNNEDRKFMHLRCDQLGINHESKNIGKKKRILTIRIPHDWKLSTPIKIHRPKKPHHKRSCNECGCDSEELFVNPFIHGAYCTYCIESIYDPDGGHKWEPL